MFKSLVASFDILAAQLYSSVCVQASSQQCGGFERKDCHRKPQEEDTQLLMKDCSQQEFVIVKSLNRKAVLWIPVIKQFVKYPTASWINGWIVAARVAATWLLYFLLPLVGPKRLLHDSGTQVISLYPFSDSFVQPLACLPDLCIFLES